MLSLYVVDRFAGQVADASITNQTFLHRDPKILTIYKNNIVNNFCPHFSTKPTIAVVLTTHFKVHVG